jgi:hypothetical protein
VQKTKATPSRVLFHDCKKVLRIVSWSRVESVGRIYKPIRFRVLTAACMKMVVFWVVAPSSLVLHWRFGGWCCRQQGPLGAWSQWHCLLALSSLFWVHIGFFYLRLFHLGNRMIRTILEGSFATRGTKPLSGSKPPSGYLAVMPNAHLKQDYLPPGIYRRGRFVRCFLHRGLAPSDCRSEGLAPRATSPLSFHHLGYRTSARMTWPEAIIVGTQCCQSATLNTVIAKVTHVSWRKSLQCHCAPNRTSSQSCTYKKIAVELFTIIL